VIALAIVRRIEQARQRDRIAIGAKRLVDGMTRAIDLRRKHQESRTHQDAAQPGLVFCAEINAGELFDYVAIP
jgi:hypothetical protein